MTNPAQSSSTPARSWPDGRTTSGELPRTESSCRRRRRLIGTASFFDPDRETVCEVHPDLLEESGGVAKYGPIKSIDYLLMKLKEAQGVEG